MDRNETIIKILEHLNVDNDTFNNDIIVSKMIESGTWTVVMLIVTVILAIAFTRFNSHFGIYVSAKKLFKLIRSTIDNRTSPQHTSIKKDSDAGHKESDFNVELTFSDILEMINDFLIKYSVFQYTVTLIILYNEIKFLWMAVSRVITESVTVANCYFAPTRILSEYIVNLLPPV